jgi:TPR repeat protein
LIFTGDCIYNFAVQGIPHSRAEEGEIHLNGVRGKGADTNALEAFRESAEKGDAHSQARMGKIYSHGLGVDRDYKLALAWYRKSAEQGNGEAQAQLGHMYEKGLGIDPDVQIALEWYKKSNEQGNALGQIFLGDLYLNGLGVDQSFRKALACYLKSAEQGRDPESAGLALLKLGAMYSLGRGVEKDLRKGFKFYHQAAKLGNAEAQRSVGAMYRDGMGVERDHKKALEWFQKSAKTNRIPADTSMGDIYRDGLVVEKNIPEAIKWYKKAAAKGDKCAKAELLKLQQGESAQEKHATVGVLPGPGESKAAAEAAKMDGLGAGVERKAGRERQRNGKAAEDGTNFVRGKPRPARQPLAAQPQMKKEAPKKTSRRAVPRQPGRTKRILAAKTRIFLFSAIGIIGLSLMIMLFSSRKKPEMIPLSVKPVAMDIAALPRPDPLSLPGVTPEPFPEILRKINAGRASRKPSAQVTVPVLGPTHAVIESKPAAPLFRRECKSLDEGAISEMLVAKNLFDAKRNPGGGFPHQYEPMNAAGLRLIVDRATKLVWLRQQNPVRMNLGKTRQWIASLNRVEYGGIRGWRLPTIEEAASLLQKNAGAGGIFLDDIFGRDIKEIWTGDSLTESESWIVDFQKGMITNAKSKTRRMTLMVSSNLNSFSKQMPIQETPASEDKAEVAHDRE